MDQFKALAILLFFSFTVLGSEAQRKPAPDFTLTDGEGQMVTLSAYKGDVVLLDFWATWCGGCKTEIPWYMEFNKKYRSRGLAVIGVAMDDEGMKVVDPFVKQKGIDYTIVIGNDALAKKYNLTAMPLTLLIDRSGRIAVSHAGVVNRVDFENAIQQLLGERTR
ncbi:MAG: TlpA family protein disulfide reductase [Acidobacteriaceae bacterium]|nr:TlpA family protein disulfide reductase [Acidobacteriaceae bacterium]